MDRIYKYNSSTSYEPNGGTYLQLITAKDLYIQNVTVAEHNGHSDSFQVKFPNVFTNYPLGAVRVEDQKFKDWDHYKFTIWQSQLISQSFVHKVLVVYLLSILTLRNQ